MTPFDALSIQAESYLEDSAPWGDHGGTMKYTLHINLEATSDADALEQAQHIIELIDRPLLRIGTWDVSGSGADGQPEWSTILPRKDD